MLILNLLDQIRNDPLSGYAALLGLVLALVFGISFHEFSHAFTAYRLGDQTPRYQGRVTLNPAAHLDPVGMIFFAIGGFGWGRPVQFNPYAIRMNPRIGSGLVAFAGPLSNMFLGLVVGLIVRVLSSIESSGTTGLALTFVTLTLANFVSYNFLLAVFNLIPLPPLDGSKILPALLPPDMAYSLERFYSQVGMAALFILFLLLWYGGSVVGPVIYEPVNALFRLVTGF